MLTEERYKLILKIVINSDNQKDFMQRANHEIPDLTPAEFLEFAERYETENV